MNKAVFFDRDGIVNRRIYCGYVTSPDDFIFLEDFFSLFKKVHELGYLTIIVTNQQGVGKGLMSEDDLERIHEFMQSELMMKFGYAFDAIFSCSDLAMSGSKRRKPEPGMLLEAANTFNINLSESWIIGDSIRDVQAGKAAGTKTVLVGKFSMIGEADIIVQHLKDIDIFDNVAM